MKEVILRKQGNSLIFTAPSDLSDNVGKKYSVNKREDGSIVYEPISHKNVFSTPAFKNYDYQNDMKNNPELSELNPVGKEKLLWVIYPLRMMS